MSITELRVFRESDIVTIKGWFEDAEVQRRLEGMQPLSEWYNYVASKEDYQVWTALDENKQPIGIVMVEQESNYVGYIALVINPILRGKGYGKALVKKVMSLPSTQSIKKWIANIETDNIACLKCFESVGYSFENSIPDEDGYYLLIYISN